jgi:hypothetical protein
LVDGVTYDSGWHDVGFERGHLAPGMYLLRLRAGSESLSRKLVIIE